MTFNSIDAPSIDTEYTNSLVMRFYTGALENYATLSTPNLHTSAYGLIWTTPGRAANRHQPGVHATGTAQSALDGGKTGRLAAHTLVLKPLDPDEVPDPGGLEPPGETRPPMDTAPWVTPGGASPGEEPGHDGDWEIVDDSGTWTPGDWFEVEPDSWDSGATYPSDSVVEHEGGWWIAPDGAAAGEEPGTDPAWEPVEPFDPGTTYDPGSVVHNDGKVWVTPDGSDPSSPGYVPGSGYYEPGEVVEHNGDWWVTPGGASPDEEPGVGGDWEQVLPWDPEETYDPGDVVEHEGEPEPGGGVVPEDKFPVGRPPGEINAIFLRGITWDGSVLWLVDANNSILMNMTYEGMWWDKYFMNPGGDPSFPDSVSDFGVWELRDITWDGTHLWIVRQSDEKILRLDPDTGGYTEEISLTNFTPTGIADDGQDQLYMHSVENERLEHMTQAGTVLDTIAHPWTTSTLAGIGWDYEREGYIWVADPEDASIRQLHAVNGALRLSRGWDADDPERPQSLQRVGNILWVCTPTWVHRFRIYDEEIEVPLRGILRWTGTRWKCQPVYRWTGSTWVRTRLLRWTGSAWTDAEIDCPPSTL